MTALHFLKMKGVKSSIFKVLVKQQLTSSEGGFDSIIVLSTARLHAPDSNECLLKLDYQTWWGCLI